MFKRFWLSKTISYVLLYLAYILMIQVEVFNLSTKTVSLKNYLNAPGMNFLQNSQKNFIFLPRKITPPFSTNFFCNLRPTYTSASLRKYDPLEEQYFLLKKTPDGPFITPQECQFLLILFLLIEVVFPPTSFLQIHTWQKFLIIQQMTKPWKKQTQLFFHCKVI